MFCKKCGKIISDDLELCEECEALEKVVVSADNSVETTKTASMVEEVNVKQSVGNAEVAVAKKKKLNGALVALILGIVAVVLVYLGKVWATSLRAQYSTLNNSYYFFEVLTYKIGFGRSLVRDIFEFLEGFIENEKWISFLFLTATNLLNISVLVALIGGILGIAGIKKYKKEAKENGKLDKNLMFSIIGLLLSVVAILFMVSVHTEIEPYIWGALREILE